MFYICASLISNNQNTKLHDNAAASNDNKNNTNNTIYVQKANMQFTYHIM